MHAVQRIASKWTLRRSTAAACMAAFALAAAPATPAAPALLQRADLKSFISEMVDEHAFDAPQLETMFGAAKLQPRIVAAISRPAERKPWYQYRPIFLTASRIEGGVEFWNTHREALQAANEAYGVPPEIIVAIIGVETRYGRHAGGYRVIDALATLAFDYPPRAKFFRSELKHYLLMTREEGFDPLALQGSYAGAMGQPQFISSSFRRYAVDFDKDGKRDIWNSTWDSIGSVANYLKLHGWDNGAPVTFKTTLEPSASADGLPIKQLKPHLAAAELAGLGLALPGQLSSDTLTSVIALETRGGPEYWIALNNFYVITRYNHSELYAMAVYQLSQAIREQYQHGQHAENTAASTSP